MPTVPIVYAIAIACGLKYFFSRIPVVAKVENGTNEYNQISNDVAELTSNTRRSSTTMYRNAFQYVFLRQKALDTFGFCLQSPTNWPCVRLFPGVGLV